MKRKKWLPLFGFVVFCIAAYLVYNALGQYDPAEIVESIAALSLPRLARAALFVAGSYFSLTFFDALAVRYVGAKLPYRRAALASFCALSIGHTLGVAAASSGAIRYRFYSRWGISAGDIAKIVLFCGVTVGIGLNTLLGLALLLHAEVAAELLGLGPGSLFALGTACLGLSGLYVASAALLRRPLSIKEWEISMPPPRLALAQIGVGAMNFCFVAAALHALLPADVGAGYFTVAAVYVIGNVVSILTHVPGGLGVLEAVVLHLMPQAAVFAALVAFRALYFLVPFAIGAVLLAAYELAQRQAGGSTSP